MITELAINDVNRSCVIHARNVPFFQNRTSVEFKPGLNILFGGNGSGKSTILTSMARMLHCEQGGRTCVTGDSLYAVYQVPMADPASRHGEKSDTMGDGILPVHDGQCVLYLDPSKAIGLAGGSFDYDFMTEGRQRSCVRI